MSERPSSQTTDLVQPGPAGVQSVADLARLLRQLRRRDARLRGDTPLTYRELAAKTGWSRGIIGEYFAGKVLPPTDRFDVLIRLLGATPAEQGALATARDRAEERRRGGTGTAAAARAAGAGPAVPRQLPADVPAFTGRSTDLAALDALLSTGGPCPAPVTAVVSGTAGVGKTALAVHWAHRVADRFPDGQLYANLRGFDPAGSAMTSAEAVRGFLDAFDVPPQRVPASLQAQVGLYRSLLAGRRVLVLLDNARDAGQVRPLLPGAPGCLAVVTSRDQLCGLVAAECAHPIGLDLLTPQEARHLLARRLGTDRVAAEPHAVDEIVERCARLPLALGVVAARAATNPQFRLDSLAGELRGARGGLDAFSRGDLVTDVRAVFSWSYHTLSPAAARLFRLLSLHPGPDIGAPAAASLAGVAVGQVRPPLSELTRAHLVVERSPGRYTGHDLLRAYATELARTVDSEAQRRAALHRVLDHYLHTAYAADRLLDPHREPITLARAVPGVSPEQLTDHVHARDWFAAELSVLLAAIDQATATGFDTHAGQLTWTMAPQLDHPDAGPTRAALSGLDREVEPSPAS